jgi:tRNA-2-methylthio-N6-dimethylallyladenosine synthase
MLAPRAPRLRRLAAALLARAGAASRRDLPEDGLGLADFVARGAGGAERPAPPPAAARRRPAADPAHPTAARSFFLETYGCAMNVADSELVAAVLGAAGWAPAASSAAADAVLLNTCAIRERAEAKVRARVGFYRNSAADAGRFARRPVVGILGCMAERLKERLLEEPGGGVDLVAGPDAYRDLPRLLDLAAGGRRAVNVQLSLDETYADLRPARRAGAVGAFVSIQRGCDNHCAFCVVPQTRGRERSRPLASIVDEVRSGAGVRDLRCDPSFSLPNPRARA